MFINQIIISQIYAVPFCHPTTFFRVRNIIHMYILFLISFLYIVQDCLEPGTISNALDPVLINDNTRYEAIATYTCRDNYYVDADAMTNTVVRSCQADGVWSTVTETCSRKLITNSKHFYYIFSAI